MGFNEPEIAIVLRQRTTAMTVTEVAQLLQVSEQTLYRYAQRGLIPVLRFGDVVRFDPTQIADWLSAQQQQKDTKYE
jgi:excisionase family DNA binding protein